MVPIIVVYFDDRGALVTSYPLDQRQRSPSGNGHGDEDATVRTQNELLHSLLEALREEFHLADFVQNDDIARCLQGLESDSLK